MLSLPAGGHAARLGAARRRPKVRTRSSQHNMRVVIKVGTSLIAPGGQIDINLLRGLVDQFDRSN